jgi:signal peptidase I
LVRARRAAGSLALTLAVALLSATQIVPRALGGQPLIVQTSSMSPAIRAGDLVAVVPVQAAELKPGDVITYATTDHLITHRVTGIGTLGPDAVIYAKGDANPVADPPIQVAQLRGKVLYHIPKWAHPAGKLQKLFRKGIA